MTMWIENSMFNYNFNWKEEYGENVRLYGRIEIPVNEIIKVLSEAKYTIFFEDKGIKIRSENEINQKLDEASEKKSEAELRSNTFLETYYEGLIDGLRWVIKGDKK